MATKAPQMSIPQLINALVGKTTVDKGKNRLVRYAVPELEKMERLVQQVASRIRAHLNKRRAINRLPPEVLLHIFSMIQPHYTDFMPTVTHQRVPGSRSPPMTPVMPWGGLQSPLPLLNSTHALLQTEWEWMILMEVCRYWRTMIASSPLMWTAIDHAFRPFTFLRRSSPAPIDLSIKKGIRGVDELSERQSFMDVLGPESARLRNLHIAPQTWVPWILRRLCKYPAPLLETLTILPLVQHYNMPPWSNVEELASGKLPKIFAGKMPKMRKLTLGTYSSWPRGLFRNLTHVFLLDQDQSRQSLSKFLDFLEESPMLEELILIDAGPTRIDGDAPERIINLPHIKEVTLGNWPGPTGVARLLSHISVPPTADIYVWGASLRGDDAGQFGILPSDTFNLPNLREMRRWTFIRERHNIHSPQAHGLGRHLHHASELPCIAILGSTQHLYMYGEWPYQLMVLHPALPLRDIEEMFLRDSAPFGYNKSVWKDIFKRMPSLAKLTLLTHDAPAMSRKVLSGLLPQDALRNGTTEDERGVDGIGMSSRRSRETGRERERLVCPLLKELAIEHDPKLSSVFISRLVEERRAHGSSIETLNVVLKNSRVTARWDDTRSDISSSSGSERPGRGDDFRSRTLDDMEQLRRCVKTVVFDHDSPVRAMGMGVWPPKTVEWIATLPGRPRFFT